MAGPEIKYLVLSKDHAFDDGLMDWDYLTTYGGDWIDTCRVIEVAVSIVADGSPRFTFGQDVTYEAITAFERQLNAPSTVTQQIREHGTYHRGIGI